VFDGGDGRQLWQRWTIETTFKGDGGGGVQWQWRCLTAFNGISGGFWQGDGEARMAGTTRGQEGGARRGNATTSWHDERTRGQHSESMTRDNSTTSWRDETTLGWHDETMR
jgi:hypothetical protein